MGARVRIATVPALDGVNGPDDLIALDGDEAIRDVSNSLSRPRSWRLLKSRPQSETFWRRSRTSLRKQMRRALDVVADVSDDLQRVMLEDRIAAAVRGVVPKGTVVREVNARRQERDARQQDFSAGIEKPSCERCRSTPRA